MLILNFECLAELYAKQLPLLNALNRLLKYSFNYYLAQIHF